jgi:hypothetical protein
MVVNLLKNPLAPERCDNPSRWGPTLPLPRAGVELSMRGDGSVSGHDSGPPIASISAIGPNREVEYPTQISISSLSAPPGLPTQPMTPPSPILSMTCQRAARTAERNAMLSLVSSPQGAMSSGGTTYPNPMLGTLSSLSSVTVTPPANTDGRVVISPRLPSHTVCSSISPTSSYSAPLSPNTAQRCCKDKRLSMSHDESASFGLPIVPGTSRSPLIFDGGSNAGSGDIGL